ncbi:MAG: hypothetical protein IIV02_06675 [Peptococcaceae bacterium]|nr:hypothetical protein [Peptococcaceae bacterium]
MQNLAAIEQINLFHGESRGYIALFQKMPSGKSRQWHYKVNELLDHIDEWQGNDVYMTLNTFRTPSRTNNNVQEFRALYIDLDTYNTEFTNEQVLMHLEADYYGSIIPRPNAIIHSGRGLCLVFMLNFAPKQAYKRWNYVQKRFVELLAPLGADKAVKDPARILRLAGTTNSKNGETVTIDYLHTEKYELSALLQDYAMDHEYIPKVKRKKSPKRNKGGKLSPYTLYKARLEDLFRLVQLRHGQMNGYREKVLFLGRYFAMHISSSETAAMDTVYNLNNMFSEPLSRQEATNSTKSAIRAYYENKSSKRMGYNYSNDSLIKELAISPEEQKSLATIISKEEKRSRRGHLSWAEHIQRLKDRKQAEICTLSAYMEKHPQAKNKELADFMGCSIRKVQMLKAEIRIIPPVVAVAEVLVNKVIGYAHNLKASVCTPVKNLVRPLFVRPPRE